MSSDSVFCPNCGLQSPRHTRFCRKCGTNLEAVSQVLTGGLAPAPSSDLAREMEIAYAKEFSSALYNLLGSVAFFVAMLAIFRNAFWVYFLLFWVANNVRDLVQAYLLKQQIKDPAAFKAALETFKEEKHKKKRKRNRRRRQAELPEVPPVVTLPPPARTTGELKEPETPAFDPANPPPSVTEGTTRLLDDEASDEHRYVPPSAVQNQK